MSDTAPSPTVLILADQDDEGIRRLASRLGERNSVTWWRFGVAETTVAADVDENGFRLSQPGAILTSADFSMAEVVVYKRRRLQPRPLLRSGLDSQTDRVFSEREWASLLEGILLDQEHRGAQSWLNAPSAWARTENKLSLLLRAAKLGLPVPSWRISTSIDLPVGAAGDVVTKAISADEEIDSNRHFSTVKLSGVELAGIRGQRVTTPSFVQRYVAPECEFRAYYVLGRMIAVRLKPSPDQVDIRHSAREEMSPSLDTLPGRLDEGLAALARELDLNYCAFDLIAPAGGDPELIDVTPAGSWDYFETEDDPFVSNALAAAIASHLDERERIRPCPTH